MTKRNNHYSPINFHFSSEAPFRLIILQSMTLSEAAQTFTRLGSDYHRRGWVLGTSGNFSCVIARSPLRLAITASSVDKGRLTDNEILEVDESGHVINGTKGRPSAETLVHVAVVQTTEASAVLHTHSVWSTILSDFHIANAGFFIEGYEMLKGLDGVNTHEHREWLPILENTQDMNDLAARTSVLMRDNPALHGFLIRRHGLYTWGKDLNAATRHVEILEFLMEAVGRRQMMEPELLSPAREKR